MSVIFGMPSGWSFSGTTANSSSSSSSSSSTSAFTDPVLLQGKAVLASKLFKNDDFLTQLAKSSFKELPPSADAVQELLWGMLNTRGDSSINEQDVRAAVTNAGGSSADGTALWSSLDPNFKGSMTAQEFVNNLFVTTAIKELMPNIRSDVDDRRAEVDLQKVQDGSQTLLGQMMNSDSPIGGPDGYINMFV